MSRDRFTEKDERGTWIITDDRSYTKNPEYKVLDTHKFLGDEGWVVKRREISGPAIEKLAAYEDLVFSPEVLQAIIKEWKEWADAKNDGRLRILPCKVGDTVFATNVSFSFTPYIRCVVIGFQISTFEKEEKLFVELDEIDPPCASLFVSADDFGKTVFMNEGEAVTMLKLTKKERKHEL